MKIVSVIFMFQGVLDSIESFPIPTSGVEFEDEFVEKGYAEIERKQVEKAEALFTQKALEINSELDEEDIAELLDNGGYDNGNGQEVLLTWSEVNLPE